MISKIFTYKMSDKIKQAEILARFVHFGQKRQDGEDYINHCERVANQISHEYIMKFLKTPLDEDQTHTDLVRAAWLHDCVEDAKSPIDVFNLIGKHFSFKVQSLVSVLS